MARRVKGNTSGLAASQLKQLERLFSRKIERSELLPHELGRELWTVSNDIGRIVGLLVAREGAITEVVVGSREILYLPDLGRYRFGKGRLRRLRLIYSDLSKASNTVTISHDIYADLEKLRLDGVMGVRVHENHVRASFAHLLPVRREDEAPVHTEEIRDLASYDLEFDVFMRELEDQLDREQIRTIAAGKTGAFLVGVYPRSVHDPEASMDELKELARTAGVEVLGEIIQRRSPDPKTLVGKGKLEEVVLRCLRLGAEMIIFDTELRPFQWRVITNSTELKVIDRSMLILDIFAQRASSADGRLQVELAQHKYNLPRLVEKDAGLSRLTGGIGGRGPGETKLEIGRRRIRDRIRMLEKRIKKLSKQRQLQRSRRKDRQISLVAILGYTNAGKSTLFNALTSGGAFTEDKLFATLEPTQRALYIPPDPSVNSEGVPAPLSGLQLVLSDTVGFIRELPEELKSAFRATLEELYESSLLLHVVDAADPQLREKIASVEAILNEMSLNDIPILLVLNKVDQLSEENAEMLRREYGGVLVSAEQRIGLVELTAAIAASLGRPGHCFPSQGIEAR